MSGITCTHSSPGSGLLANVQESIQKVVEQKKKHTPITKLYIPGAEQVLL